MSEAALAVLETDDSFQPEVHSEASRYDGSRTPADKQLLIWQLFERDQRTVTDIAQILKMNAYTVKAVIERKDQLISDARMLLKANALEFAHNAITAADEAAKRGKLEGISAMLDRLGVTEPPKSAQQTNVAVQVNLHGGPDPVSLAKVVETSETSTHQAQNSTGPITYLTSTVASGPQAQLAQALNSGSGVDTLTQVMEASNPAASPAANVAHSEKQA